MDYFEAKSDAGSENEEALEPLNSLQQDNSSISDVEECKTSSAPRQEKILQTTTCWFLIASLLLILSNGAWVLLVLLDWPSRSTEPAITADALSCMTISLTQKI